MRKRNGQSPADQLIAELSSKNQRAQREINEKQGELETWHRRAREAAAEVRALREEVQMWKAEAALLNRMYDKQGDSFNKLYDRLDRMQSELVRLAMRPPSVIDPTEAIREITEGLAKVINGWNVGVATENGVPVNQAEETSMEHAHDHMAGTARAQWVPNVEFDTWMNPGSEAALGNTAGMPTPGEWVTTTPSPVAEGQTPSHGMTPTGDVVRLDGQPMFQTGSGAAPPQGGVE